jgi:hypothetical protein
LGVLPVKQGHGSYVFHAEMDLDTLHAQLNNESDEASSQPKKILDLTNHKLDV